jgi:NitT/TauT family transport system ATP-binding protein
MNAIAAVNPSQAIPLHQPDPLITIDRLQIRFGEVTAIDEFSLIVHRGEFISLLGPSGCGKSTLLRAIARLVPVAGGNITMRDPKLRVGFMFQKPLLLPWRTALGNVVLPVEIQNGGSVVDSTDDYRARQMLDMVQLREFVNAYPHQLSGGMQQRVALARALMSDPDVLLLDEPFGALDELTREVLNEELVRIWQSRATRLKTVIMVTHSIPEAVTMSDRVIVLTARPARLVEDVAVNAPRPRAPEDPDSIAIMKHIRVMVRASR